MTVTPVTLTGTIAGDGPPLMILHGLFGQAKNWGGIVKSLTDQFTVHALDLRNHGQSPRSDIMTYEAMAADIAHYIDVHDLDAPVILGHSMGGKAAMLAALNHGNQINRLIVADIAPVAYDHEFGVHFDALEAIDLAALASRQDADKTMASMIKDPGVRAFLLSNLMRDRDDGWRWAMNHTVLRAAMDEITGWPDTSDLTFDRPVLFLHGAKSDYVTGDMKAVISALFPQAEYDAIDDAGHWLHADQPKAFTERCLAFLAP